MSIDRQLSVLIGRCDLAARSSPCTDQRVTRHNHILSEAKMCKLVPRVDVAEGDAVVNEAYFAELAVDVLDNQSPITEYGMRGGLHAMCDRVRKLFLGAINLRLAVLGLVTKHALLSLTGTSDTRDFPDTVEEVLHLLRQRVSKSGNTTMVESTRCRFWGLVVKCGTLMCAAKSELRVFDLKVQRHVATRCDGGKQYLCYNFLGHDLVLAIAEFVGYQCISRILLLSKAFSQDDNIKKLMPHISVRCVPMLFPHGTKLVPGVGHCSVVSKNTQVHLVVDLAITGARRPGMIYSTV